MKNALFVIEPYQWNGIWVFDDPRVGLQQEPFVSGMPEIIELAGGTALILGYRTRLAAVVLAVFTVMAALAFHSHFADQNQMIHFLKNVAIAGGLLQIAAFGGGGFSLDARGRRK